MKVRTIITINDTIDQRTGAKLAGFLLKLDPVLTDPSVDVLKEQVRIRWYTTQGTVVEAAMLWFSMLLGCWVHIGRDLRPADISEVRVMEEV